LGLILRGYHTTHSGHYGMSGFRFRFMVTLQFFSHQHLAPDGNKKNRTLRFLRDQSWDCFVLNSASLSTEIINQVNLTYPRQACLCVKKNVLTQSQPVTNVPLYAKPVSFFLNLPRAPSNFLKVQNKNQICRINPTAPPVLHM